MPKICYVGKNFSQPVRETIASAELIIDEYAAQGFILTLRQLYYQFVARGLIPNTEQSYKRLGNIISDARRAGLIDWNSIEDRTRYVRKLGSWDKPQEIIETARDTYHRDLWANQDTRLEVWIEKDALVGVIEGICNELDVPFFSCRGYISDSEIWRGARRIRAHQTKAQRTIILHLGDHDPSGIDMTRDITERLQLFTDYSDLDVTRVALTMEQVEELNPPPNPAKVTDSRYQSYLAQYGNSSWELDALEPQYIVDLIRNEILSERDIDLWDEVYSQQERERNQIDELLKRWGELFKEE